MTDDIDALCSLDHAEDGAFAVVFLDLLDGEVEVPRAGLGDLCSLRASEEDSLGALAMVV
jgi:hypothetical protein